MAKPLIQFLAEVGGHCCQWDFMQQYKGMTNKATAAKIGVSERTVCDTRGMINDGGVCCRKRADCKLKSA